MKHGTKDQNMATVPKINRANRIGGICSAARAAGVTRQHARLVWLGERRSPALLKKLRSRILPRAVRHSIKPATNKPTR